MSALLWLPLILTMPLWGTLLLWEVFFRVEIAIDKYKKKKARNS